MAIRDEALRLVGRAMSKHSPAPSRNCASADMEIRDRGHAPCTTLHRAHQAVGYVSGLRRRRLRNDSLGLGTSASDGTPLTMRANVDGSTSLVFDDGNLVGIGSTNCAGALFMSVSAGTAGDRTAFTLH